jgi:hypothetical protein
MRWAHRARFDRRAVECTVKGPETLETSRLVLRRPRAGDAEILFARYAEFPNLAPGVAADVLCYATILEAGRIEEPHGEVGR